MKRILLVLTAALASLLLIAAAMAVYAFKVELDLDLGRHRGTVARALGYALDADVSIGGALRVYTGPSAGVEAGDVRVAGRGYAFDARSLRLRLRSAALLSRVVSVDEGVFEGIRFCIGERPGAQEPAALPDSGEGSWRVAEVTRLHAAGIRILEGLPCDESRVRVAVSSLDAESVRGRPLEIRARGLLRGEPWEIAASGPPISELESGVKAVAYDFKAQLAGVHVHGKGQSLPARGRGHADVALETGQFAAFLSALGAPFRDFGPIAARGRVEWDGARLAVAVDEAKLAPGSLSGSLSIDGSDGTRRVTLSASTPELDVPALRAWLDASLRPGGEPGGGVRLMAALFTATDGKLDLRIRKLVTGDEPIADVVFEGLWSGGVAGASVEAQMRGKPVDGKVKADVRGAEADLSVELHTRDFALDRHAPLTGVVQDLRIAAEVKGPPGAPLEKTLRASLAASNGRIMVPRGQGPPVEIALKSGRLEWHPGDRLRIDLSGSAGGENFALRMEGSGASRFARGEDWPLSLNGSYGPLDFEARGPVSVDRARLEGRVSAAALGGLAARLGAKVLTPLNLDARGRVVVSRHDWQAEIDAVSLGNSRGRVKASGGLGESARPLNAALDLELLDLAQLGGPRPDGAGADLLPRKLPLPDADLLIAAQRVALPGTGLGPVRVEARAREGRLQRADWSAEFRGAALSGTVSADLRGEQAKLAASARAQGVDLRALVPAIERANLRANADAVELSVAARGNRRDELAASADLRANLQGLLLSADREGSGAAFQVRFPSLQGAGAPGKGLTLRGAAEINRQRVAFDAALPPLGALAAEREARDLPLRATLRSGESTLAVQAALAGQRLSGIELRLRTPRLDGLGKLAGEDLPPVGPLDFHARLQRLEADTIAADISARVAGSKVAGPLTYRRVGARHVLEADLAGPLIRIEDLGSAHWDDEEPEAAELRPAEGANAGAADALRNVDLRLRLVIDRVTAAGIEMGKTESTVRLEGGRLRADPVRMRIDGAALDASLEADFSGNEPAYRLRADLADFRYGAIVKTMNPGASHKGTVSVTADLRTTGRGEQLLHRLEGTQVAMVVPEGQAIRGLDLLGGGLLRILQGRLFSEKTSEVNCVVTSYAYGGGKAASRALMIDTPLTRSAGGIDIDLRTRALKGVVASRPKSPTLFRSVEAVEVRGTLSDPVVSVAPREAATAAARLWVFAPAFVFDVVAGEKMDPDGRADCRATYADLRKEQ